MKENILLLGAYGQNNLGDELLLATFVEMFKNYNVAANSSNPDETSKQFGIKAFKSGFQLLKWLFVSKYVIVGGGSQFKTLPQVFKRNPHALLINILLVTVVARLLFKKVYFISVGAGPLDTKLSRFLTSLIIRFSNKILLRDSQSFELMHSVFKNSKLTLSSDGLYFAKTRITKNLKFTTEQKQKSKKILIAPNLHLKDEALRNKELSVLADVARNLISQGFRVYFLPFQIGFTEIDDLVASQMIVNKMGIKLGYEPFLSLQKYDDVYKIIDEQYVLIGVRLHSVIISSLCKTPVIALSYDPKVRGYMDDLNLSEFCFDINEHLTAENVLHAFAKINNDYKTVVDKINQGTNKIGNLLEQSIQNIELLNDAE